jgi:uncharacterized membrane-anchored protein
MAGTGVDDMMMTRVLLAVGAVMIFGTVNWQVAGKEQLRANGRTVYLDLAPRDPRSLMQGDYMALNFRVAQDISRMGPTEGGAAILKLDDRGVGDFVRLDTGAPRDPAEVRFRFRLRKDSVWLGTNAFFFHEGDEERYRGARYGEFRVNDDGDAMLVNLRGEIPHRFPPAAP